MLDYSNNPEIMARLKGQLRSYQVSAVAQAIKNRVCLFDMYMGLGKTVSCLTALFGIRPRRVLILCGQAALGTWIKEIGYWFPEFADPAEFVIIKAQGGPTQHAKLWAKDCTFYICTKETYLLDVKAGKIPSWLSFDAYVIDEAHKIPGHNTATYKALEKALRDIPGKFMLSGTWIKRHAGRGWRQLHMLSRKHFPSYWKFVNRYCIVVDNGFGKQIIGPQNTEEFRIMIAPFVYRYHEIDGNIPKSARKVLWVDMSKEQAKVYNDLAERMFTMLESGELIISSVSLATFTKHRQLLCCPKILSETLGLGTAFESVLALLKENEDDPEEQHAVVFSPFRDAIPYFERALQALGYKTFVFVGGTPGAIVQQRSEAFRALKGKKSIALCTIDFAESFQLGTALRSHFIGVHWDADPMKQAEARLARADSDLSKTIVHRYWLYSDTMDEDRLDTIYGRVKHVKELFRNVDDVRAALLRKRNNPP